MEGNTEQYSLEAGTGGTPDYLPILKRAGMFVGIRPLMKVGPIVGPAGTKGFEGIAGIRVRIGCPADAKVDVANVDAAAEIAFPALHAKTAKRGATYCSFLIVPSFELGKDVPDIEPIRKGVAETIGSALAELEALLPEADEGDEWINKREVSHWVHEQLMAQVDKLGEQIEAFEAKKKASEAEAEAQTKKAQTKASLSVLPGGLDDPKKH